MYVYTYMYSYIHEFQTPALCFANTVASNHMYAHIHIHTYKSFKPQLFACQENRLRHSCMYIYIHTYAYIHEFYHPTLCLPRLLPPTLMYVYVYTSVYGYKLCTYSYTNSLPAKTVASDSDVRQSICTSDVYIRYTYIRIRVSEVQPIPLGVTFSNAVSKLKAQSSNVSFHRNVAKETFEL